MYASAAPSVTAATATKTAAKKKYENMYVCNKKKKVKKYSTTGEGLRNSHAVYSYC